MTNEAMTTEFTHNGLACKIYLTGMGYYCGYVAVGPDHPWFGHGYNDEVDAHGGLTFAGKHKGSDLWWLGFDCAHVGDGLRMGDPGWKDADYVAAQCRRLAEQLAAPPAPDQPKEG